MILMVLVVVHVQYAAPTKGPIFYDLILANDAVQGKLLICIFSFNFVFGGASMQQVVTTLEALGAAGLVMVVESDSAGSMFTPIPLTMPGIVLVDAMHSEANTLVLDPDLES